MADYADGDLSLSAKQEMRGCQMATRQVGVGGIGTTTPNIVPFGKLKGIRMMLLTEFTGYSLRGLVFNGMLN